MKKLYPFMLLFLCFCSSLVAQEDSLTVEYRQETDTFQPATFANMQAYVFMEQVETPSLWKLPLIGVGSQQSEYEIGANAFPAPRSFIEYERKLNSFLSLNMGVGFGASILNSEFQVDHAGLNVEPRWYLGMRKKVANGESANNLSGNYIGLQLSAFQYQGVNDNREAGQFVSWYENSTLPQTTGMAALLNFGIQRRILRRGYFNIKAGVGASYYQDTDLGYDAVNDQVFLEVDEGWHPAFQAELTYGLAFGQGKPDEGRLCDALLCFQEESRLLKINFANLINGLNRDYYSGSLALAYEQKLGASPFSLQLDVTGQYTGYSNQLSRLRNGYVEVGFEPRYYYNLNKRIAQGKSGNNLSANYFTLRTSFRSGQESFRAETLAVSENTQRYNYLLFTPAWGFQRRIFKHGYIGYQLGLTYGRDIDSDLSAADNVFELRSDFNFGLAF
jgi:hypothetical protein